MSVRFPAPSQAPTTRPAGSTTNARRIAAMVSAVRRHWNGTAATGLILGTGHGSLVEAVSVEAQIAYCEIPGFPISTAPGHAGMFICGRIGQQPVILLQGRCHRYEGYSAEEVARPVELLHALGCQRVFVSCAAGGLASDLQVGDFLIVDDHLDLSQRPMEAGSPRVRNSPVYDSQARSQLEAAARRLGIPARHGTYLSVTGPNYETRAELRFFQRLADAVGMSTVPEILTAHRLGLSACALATITNVCNPDRRQVADSDHVLKAAAQAAPRFHALVVEFLKSSSRAT